MANNYTNHLRDKHKMRLEASMARPQRPRFEDEVTLNNALFKMQKEAPKSSQATIGLLDELQKNWDSGRKGGASDALISGIKAGIARKSLLDDEERLSKYTGALEKMQGMVQEQNQRLYQEEKLANARESLTPRVAAYLEQAKNMNPDARAMYIQRAMDEYNKLADTGYKVASIDGFEPWKITAIDNDEAQVIDLMDFIKTPQEKRLDLYMRSPEYQQMENHLKQDDKMERDERRSSTDLNRLKADVYRDQAREKQDYSQIEDDIRNQAGDEVRVIAGLAPSLQLNAEKDIKEYTQKANEDLAAEKRLERAIQIASEHPELFANLNSIIASRYNEEPGYLNTLLKSKIPSKSLDAMSELSGIVKNIFTDSVKGVPSKGVNQFIEKKLEGGSPNTRWTANAFKKVVEEAKKDYEFKYGEHKKGSDYGARGLHYRLRAKEREAMNPNPSNSIQQLQAADPSLTPEMIEEAQRRLNGGQ